MIWRRFLCVLLGGVVFWLPTAMVELATRHELNGVIGTIVPPAILLIAYILLRRSIRLRNAALWMLVGVFVLGPLFMTAGATALGAGFLHFVGWKDFGYLALECIVPPLTLVLAGYDGTLFGVLLATVLMPSLQRWCNRRGARPLETHGAETATV